jgi:hypothetical protein
VSEKEQILLYHHCVSCGKKYPLGVNSCPDCEGAPVRSVYGPPVPPPFCKAEDFDTLEKVENGFKGKCCKCGKEQLWKSRDEWLHGQCMFCGARGIDGHGGKLFNKQELKPYTESVIEKILYPYGYKINNSPLTASLPQPRQPLFTDYPEKLKFEPKVFIQSKIKLPILEPQPLQNWSPDLAEIPVKSSLKKLDLTAFLKASDDNHK